MSDPLSPSKLPTPPPTDDSSQGSPAPRLGFAQSLLQANQELRATVVSNVIKKGLIGLGVGLGLGLFVFKRKTAPIMFTTGIGLGMAYTEGSQMVRDYHEAIRLRAIGEQQRHYKVPPGEL